MTKWDFRVSWISVFEKIQKLHMLKCMLKWINRFTVYFQVYILAWCYLEANCFTYNYDGIKKWPLSEFGSITVKDSEVF